MQSFIVVDDFILQGAILQKMLSQPPYQFAYLGQAVNGEEGLDLARRTRPSLMFIDIEMPGIDGLTVAKVISEEMPDVRLVILSAHDDFSYAQQALRINVDDYLLKPTTAASLEEVIDRMRFSVSKKSSSPDLRRGERLLGVAGELSDAIVYGDEETVNDRFAQLRFMWPDNTVLPDRSKGELICTLALLVVQRLEQEEHSPGAIRSFYERFVQEYRADCKPEQCLGDLHRLLLSCFNSFHCYEPQESCSHIHIARNWIKEHLSEDITLNAIASQVFLSPTHLSRLFRRYEGITISEYLLRERLVRARCLLASTGDNIETIALKCGYDKVNSFWKMFKRQEGISPGQYREKHRAGALSPEKHTAKEGAAPGPAGEP